jgi:hypothetical protein
MISRTFAAHDAALRGDAALVTPHAASIAIFSPEISRMRHAIAPQMGRALRYLSDWTARKSMQE